MSEKIFGFFFAFFFSFFFVFTFVRFFSCRGIRNKMGKRKSVDEIQRNVKLTRKSASFITRLPVEATGALENVVLKGCSKRTWKCLVKLTGIVRPYANVHKQIKELGEWDEFVKRCLLKPGFKDKMKNTIEMEKWLVENARDGSLASLGSDDEKDLIVVISPGETGSQFLLMGDNITNPNGFTSSQIENFIPRPAKTKSHKKHTLVLHRSGFSIDDGFENPLTKFKKCDILLDLESRSSVTDQIPNKKFVLVAPNCGVFYESGTKPKYVPKNDLEILIGKMDSGELKSLLQKLIRFSPQQVEMGPVRYDTSQVLQAVCESSALHPGGKSPNTGLFVRGLPSFLKRLAITMVEDSWVDEHILHDLLLMSIIATNDPDYFPTSIQLARIYESAQCALISKKAVVYKQDQAGDPIPLKPKLNEIKRASCFLDILKSFPWDLTMLRYVSKHNMAFQETNIERPKIMDISHYLDHHVGPEFAYFMNPKALQIAKSRYVPSEIFGDLNHCKSKPFAILFREVFHASSGFNYRRTPDKNMETDEMVQIVRLAQSNYFLEKHGHKLGMETAEIKTPSLPNVMIEKELDPMWMASEIGHMTVRVQQQNYFVFITQVEPEIVLGVSRVPARNQKDVEIDEVARLEAIKKGFQVLKSGIKLQSNSIFGNREIVLKDKKLHFRDGDDIFIPNMIVSMSTSCDLSKIESVLTKMSLSSLRRLWQLSLGFCKLIEFPKITRSGGPDDKPINIYDIEVFQTCLLLQPVLKLTRLRFFQVMEPIVWWHIRDEILKPLLDNKKSKNKRSEKWIMFADKMNRVITPQQNQALELLTNRSDQNNFLIMGVGSGKTMVTCLFLLHLFKIGKLPKHVLFVTPSCAMKSVENELRQFTDFVEVRDMTKSKKQKNDLAVGITLLSQDHMRLVGNLFKKTLPKTYLFLDEFHLCLAQKTLRTKFALESAAICKNFTALSGTPTISHLLYDLMPLLTPIVPFELTMNNFFVGYSFAVNQKSCSKIKVENKKIGLNMPVERSEYWDLLPCSLGGKNEKRLDIRDLNQLIDYSQDQASIKMVNLTIEHIKQKDVVFLVARKVGHVQQLCDLLVGQGVVRSDIYCLFEQKDAIILTESSITNSRQKDPRLKRYKIVICPISCSLGFSMPICNVQISTIYPSNAAKREQIRGRINRLSSCFDQILYIDVICGRIQELIEFKQDRADSLSSILRDLSQDCNGLTTGQCNLLGI